MTSSNTNNARLRGSWIKILLFAFGLLLLSAVPARAQSVGGCVANFGGVIDGFVNPVPPSQINIDGNCTIRNFPASNPLTSNISFTGTGRGWLVIFDNVDFTGNLSCDKSHGNFIWFVNGSITGAHVLGCANLFVPVDKIDKENPPGPPFVSIGVPFTYTLTFPQLVSATTGAVVNPNGSNVEVDQVTVTDNLNATGVSLSYVNSSAAWKGGLERKRAAHLQRFPPDPSRAADRGERHCGAQQRRAAELARHAVLQHGQLDVRNDHRRNLPFPADRTAGGLVAAADYRGARPGDDQGRPCDDEPWPAGAVHPQRAEHRQ